MSVEANPLLGWDSTRSARLVPLAASRLGAQLLSLAWFMIAARSLNTASFGELAAGTAFMVVFAALGDLGTTRTITRHVAAGTSSAWDTYRKSVVLRAAGGIGITAPIVVVVALASSQPPPMIVLLAGVLATVSGITELGYAALRSAGRVTTEVVWLPLERVLFVGLGWYAVEAGGGAVAVLAVYILTNLVTAIATGLVVHRVGRSGEGAVPALLDAEARRSAVGFALLALGPRVTPLLLSVLAASDTVATYAVAWRPVEGVSLLAISLVTPVLPMLRSLHTRGKSAELDRAVQSVSHATIVALLPIVLWFLFAPSQVIRLLVGSDKYSEAEPLLSILAAVVLTWFLRSLAEATLLAREKAGTFAAITTTGFAFTVVAAPILIVALDASGAAWATLGAELIMLALILGLVPALRALPPERRGIRLGLVGASVVATAVATQVSPWVAAVLVGSVAALAGLAAARDLSALEQRLLATRPQAR